MRSFWIGAVRTVNKTTVLVRVSPNGPWLEDATYSNFDIRDPHTGCVSFDRLHWANGMLNLFYKNLL